MTLKDGSYVAGALEWYSTEVEETTDRDFVLAAPLSLRAADAQEPETLEGFSRLVVSARDVIRLYVSYVKPELWETSAASE